MCEPVAWHWLTFDGSTCCVRCDLMALTLMHINASNCSCGWSTSVLVGRIYVCVYARAEIDCGPSSTNAFTNFFSSVIDAQLGSCSQVTNQLVYQPLPMLISSTQVQLHCRLDFFTYQYLFQNEISDDFSSKSLLKLLIHSNAHVHNYRSRKKRWNLELEIGFRL